MVFGGGPVFVPKGKRPIPERGISTRVIALKLVVRFHYLGGIASTTRPTTMARTCVHKNNQASMISCDVYLLLDFHDGRCAAQHADRGRNHTRGQCRRLIAPNNVRQSAHSDIERCLEGCSRQVWQTQHGESFFEPRPSAPYSSLTFLIRMLWQLARFWTASGTTSRPGPLAITTTCVTPPPCTTAKQLQPPPVGAVLQLASRFPWVVGHCVMKLNCCWVLETHVLTHFWIH